ncbi:13872_t:CDS:2 [Funneliformis caledonium]|uniref:13872_t:CDS:1 n=1 Tax=Funneliformis caledonium TaxID=1117310 RepID=A0A9N9EA00_9GLOM|nr:13872_t:CDS:2 [Funneliformis caledonium]
MENLIDSLDTFLNNASITSIDNDDSFIHLYKSAILQSTDIIYVDASYNNIPWFSDIAIVIDINETIHYTTDQEACFRKILLLGELFINSLSRIATFTFAIVKWYDYYEPKRGDYEPTKIYGCSRLRMLQEYNVMPLDFISHAVHIIPRFHKEKSIFNE